MLGKHPASSTDEQQSSRQKTSPRQPLPPVGGYVEEESDGKSSEAEGGSQEAALVLDSD